MTTDTSMTVSEAGRKGGKSRSAAKLRAVRKNGKRGGRPKGSKDHDTPERRAEAWAAWRMSADRAWKLVNRITSMKILDIAPLAGASVRTIKSRTRRLEKLIAERVRAHGDTSDASL